MRKIFYAVFLLILLIVFSVYYVNIHGNLQDPEVTLVKSFEYSGAEVISSEIYFWAKLDSQFNSLDKIKNIATEFTKELGIDGKKLISNKVINNSTVQKLEIRGITSNQKIVDMNIQLGKSPENIDEKFISVQITQDLSADGLYECKEPVLRVFKKYKIDPKINSCITGNYAGKLDYNQLNDIAKRVFKGAEAKKVEGMREDNLISVSAYSPSIGEYLKVGGKKVNLNLAIRYNSLEDKTYIWLATPVITVEY